MLAYHAADIGFESAKGHPRFARLQAAGPWAYKAHPAGGTLAFWPVGDRMPALTDYGTPRPTHDGLTYYPPKELPHLSTLAKPAAQRDDTNRVQLACGLSAFVVPAYLEPRRVLTDGTIGDPVTEYGRQSRKALDLYGVKEGPSILDPTLQKLCRMALMSGQRLTDELIDDYGLLTTADVDPIIDATWHVPKKNEAEIAPSPSQLQPDP